MKQIVMITALLCLGTGLMAQGQKGSKQGPPPEMSIEEITKELSLTDDQVTQWEEIHKKYPKPSSGQRPSKETMEAMTQEIEAILTDEQIEKFTAMREKSKKQGPPRN
ncbi:Spy/CpxP family protein refolding chaperone [Reichenbachiella agarivorans]|uniref:Spy/CpxP family protein refolding chaperone n=1 Tax=Reichenbachiella agarivorans TaxID=2979464 RepID=A0ABY6CL40_9BACT|nr:Spy/CpxP family protein refolding chaperone [Reichenbachiella agarivorans]UXP31236.1 Spy/CpxP family protein refolding chaperone [Reichenbachiella agarivorans]